MSDWKRTTKEVSLERLPPEIASAIHRHIEQFNLGPILSEARMCIQTDSEKLKTGLFGNSERVRMVAIVTPRWLVWSVAEPETEPAVMSAQLSNITVEDYAQTLFAEMVADYGIQASGMFTGASEGAGAFIGLDEGEAGNKFRDMVIQAAQDAKK